ncbi:MAG: FAD-binding protein [Oscillospiraceae bacterium]|jgi:succinate dehydrogenase/fumarate reductase flavoprotein subunit|nr:FAD-binding protein [Oscillospiraceae bacterium]
MAEDNRAAVIKDLGEDREALMFPGPDDITVFGKERVKRWSWETPPDPIPEERITETVEADAIIVGGGISGLATAARAAELGLKVIVLEKTGGFVAHGMEISSIGSSVQRRYGVHVDKYQFARDWMRICGSRVNEDLLWLFINRSEEAFEWLLGLGGDDVYTDLWGAYYRGSDFTEYPVAQHIYQKPGVKRWKYSGALMYCEMLYEVAVKGGGKIIRNTQAVRLEKENGRVAAVIAKNLKEDRLIRYRGARGVVLATGDIGGDAEMLEAFSPWGLLPGRCVSWPKGSNLGEGHKMGYWAGGKLEAGPWAPSLHMIGYGVFFDFFLHVNPLGNRFMNEDTWSGGKSARILMQPGGDYAFNVFDANWYEDVKRGGPYHGGQGATTPIDQRQGFDDEGIGYRKERLEDIIQRGVGWRADTLEELAEKMGVPAGNFLKTVRRYNGIVKNGEDVDYGKRPELLTPVEKPPYCAVKIGPALLNVFGGLETDVKLRVLDGNRTPLGGLLAVGMIAGGFCSVDYPLLAAGNSHGRCLTWGRVAAETLAANEA